ncbi:MAG: phage portal protein [Armatimonadia bacterium]
MSDKALEVAHNPAAPADEQRDAMAVAQKAAMPSSVVDMLPVVEFMRNQYAEQEMTKALTKPNVIPFPSKAIKEKQPGMQSVFLDERRVELLGDYYERPGAFAFDLMRTMVDQTPILSSVIWTRQRQVRRFCRVQESGKGPGFAIRPKDPTAKLGEQEQQSIKLLEGFFTNCGWETNPRQRMRLKRDNFSNFMAKLVRDSLVLDSMPIETEWKRDKSLGLDGMYAVDGATVRLCSESGYRGDDEIFALQVVQGNLRAAYTYDDLIYVPRNPRTDVMVGSYGFSETELLIKVVTGLLNAMTYNLKYFDSNSIPKGLLHLSGDYSNEDLSAFKRYWNAMVKGINNAWTLPVMVSKNQESKASFENFGVDVNEIMFAKWMTFLTSIICAIYGMAPDEINFESFTAGTSSLSGSDTEEKLINSKDKGLRPLLAYYEDIFSDYIVSDFGDKYCFRWTGLDELSPEQSWVEETALRTVNEARKARGWEEVEWGDAPLNQVVMGAYMQNLQGSQEDYGNPDAPGGVGQFGNGPGQPGQPGGAPDQDQVPGKDAPQDDNGEDMQKSFGLPVWRVDP